MSALLWLRWCGVMRRDEQWLALSRFGLIPRCLVAAAATRISEGRPAAFFPFSFLREPPTHSQHSQNKQLRGRALTTLRFHSHHCTLTFSSLPPPRLPPLPRLRCRRTSFVRSSVPCVP